MGTKTYAVNANVNLVHGSKVTVTVMATNAAGLTSLAYSNETTIDLTPPRIDFVNDGSRQTGKSEVITQSSVQF